MGGIIYGPYTGTWFDSTSQTDIEHIVARSEAHDSGLRAVDAATKRRFSSDLLNLTLASPAVNRSQKSAKDAAEWLPGLNQCWFANRVVEVRQRYELTVDQRERNVLEGVLQAARRPGWWCGKAVRPQRRRRSPLGRRTDRRCLPAVRRQRERPHHLRRGAEARHRSRSPRPSRVPLHE